ncbi:kinetochore protein SPC25 [Populus alba x Populus x berolinensis]|uniref:Kinetochore protein SPC25 n=1 Tax=Populus alba x Populus x berolinensis TaxID=444605 RepID=A0AAD6M265_9ROSI|nr:kinetochore protein SPC25 [Populus alba x Populus x berolinensis]
MESLRLICERDAKIQLQKVDSFMASFCNSLDSIKAIVEETMQNQGKSGRLKSSLREADEEFVKVLAVKTRKEAKQMTTRESISATRARIQELQKSVLVQRARRDEYATIMSQLSLALATSEEIEHQDIDHKRDIQEAMLWYNRVLGFKIEGGQGVKFTLNNINLKNQDEECSFTIRHENDMYTLLGCDPQLNDTKQLIHELNKTNGLFKFVRNMREKFQESASLALGFLPQTTTLHQESATVSVSAPALSISCDTSESATKTSKTPDEHIRNSKGGRGRGRGRGSRAIMSPVSVRQSPRFKVTSF